LLSPVFMKHQFVQTVAIGAMVASSAFSQANQRQATIVGGAGPDRGKCTVEVVVDGAAQVEIRGNSASLRTLSGQPAQWRRFECTGPVPSNVADFRFSGVDGRGRQQLVRDPRNGGVAVVQIEDPEGGAEGYTFDLNWDTRSTSNQPNYAPNQPNYAPNQPNYAPQQQQRIPNNNYPPDADRMRGSSEAPGGYRRDDDEQYRPGYRDSDYYRRYGHGFGADEAVRVCQESVAQQARRRFGRADVHFNRTRLDDQPGRNDWVVGTVDVHRGRGEERFRFSCSVNFDTGRVRSADLDLRPLDGDSRWR
jgi:hypothetical protein